MSKITKKQRILNLVAAEPELKAIEIAQRLKIKPQTVHTVLYLARKGTATKKTPKNTSAITKNSLSDDLSKLTTDIKNLLVEIMSQQIIIKYLENRISGLEQTNASPV